ncbi:MAG: glycosyltransferase [Clostridia bacterium]|nr:glycosyltransferase [Clostridia bacterium]
MDGAATELRYSVLISVYCKEKAEYLSAAINSIWYQTVPTDDFVLVCDGPLSPELDAVVEENAQKHPDVLHVIRLEENSGLGTALNIGIQECRHELIARMDSDDISRPDRCEKQLAVFRAHPEFSIVSGIVEEFSSSVDVVEGRRVLPEKQEDILRFARKRNPFNHPCAMYRKSAVEAAGGYQDFHFLEDYYLWIRMLQKGSIGYNMQEPLLWMRAGSEMYRRRAGRAYAKSQIKLFRYMKDSGFIGTGDYLISVFMRSVSSVLPNWLRVAIFKIALRK